jgi:effector-binding domain-containing protein
MDYTCEVVERSAQVVLSMRTRTKVEDLQQFFGKAYGGIMQYLGELGEFPLGMPFGAYYNMDMQDLDVEAGFPVARPIPGKGEIIASQIPAGRFATCLYYGPYDQIAPAYEALTAWIQANGYEPSGIAYEYYLNDPAEVPPEQVATRIEFLLK